MDYPYAPSWREYCRRARVLVARDEVPVELQAEMRELFAEYLHTRMGRDEFNGRFTHVCLRYRRKRQVRTAALWLTPVVAGLGVLCILWRGAR